MRIAYGIHGYGKGHAGRSLAAIAALRKRHDVHVWCGGDAYDIVAPEVETTAIESLGFSYDPAGRRSNWYSFWANFELGRDILLRGPGARKIEAQLAAFAPDVIISDAEPYLHRAGRWMGIPRIGFDHFGVMTWCRPPLAGADRYRILFDRWLYRTFLGRPERVLISSFFPAPPRFEGVEVVPPLLRDAVHRAVARQGSHLLVYLNNGDEQLSAGLLTALDGLEMPVHLYGCSRRGARGHVQFLPPSNEGFVEDLASCRAVLSTAGNQLVGEALHFGKPMLVMPEKCVEQRMNATALVQLGVGEAHDPQAISTELLQGFLIRAPRYARVAASHGEDGTEAAIAHLERWMRELHAERAARSGELAA